MNNQVELTLTKMESSPLIKINRENIFFKKIPIIEGKFDINKDIKDNENTIYFINGYKISDKNAINELKRKELKKHTIIIFGERKFSEDDKINLNNPEIYNLTFESLKINDYKIYLQNKKITKNKDDFDMEIKKLVENNNIIEDEDLLRKRIYRLI